MDENLQDRVCEAVVAEFRRQAENQPARLKVDSSREDRLRIEGEVQLDELAGAIVGAIAGGP
jgi:hypothetical protein